jgi:hypothetical protein
MKRVFVAGVVALALLAVTRQQASAWCKFNFGVGMNISYEAGGNTKSFLFYQRTSSPFPDGGPWAHGGYAVPAYAYGYAYPAPAAPAAAPAAPAAPAPQVLPAPVPVSSGVQQTGYYGYGYGYGYDYGYGYATPAYYSGY